MRSSGFQAHIDLDTFGVEERRWPSDLFGHKALSHKYCICCFFLPMIVYALPEWCYGHEIFNANNLRTLNWSSMHFAQICLNILRYHPGQYPLSDGCSVPRWRAAGLCPEARMKSCTIDPSRTRKAGCQGYIIIKG